MKVTTFPIGKSGKRAKKAGNRRKGKRARKKTDGLIGLPSLDREFRKRFKPDADC